MTKTTSTAAATITATATRLLWDSDDDGYYLINSESYSGLCTSTSTRITTGT